MRDINGPFPPRTIPPSPTVAWFLRDLVPDAVWRQFDLGSVDSEDLTSIRQRLFQAGGREAWLRFIEGVRNELPHTLSIAISDVFNDARLRNPFSRTVIVTQKPRLSVYVGGRLVRPALEFDLSARFCLRADLSDRLGEHVLADTQLQLLHDGKDVVPPIRGQYYLPVPVVDEDRS